MEGSEENKEGRMSRSSALIAIGELRAEITHIKERLKACEEELEL